MNKYIVYCIENKFNGKVYIGSTKRGLKQRKLEHLRLLKRNKHYNVYLQQDFNLYAEYIEFKELRQCNTYEEMLVLETAFINKYGGIESEMVYNYQDNETKNSEYGSKISQSHKGKTTWNKGRKMTPAEIEVNSKSHIGIRRSKESIEKQKATIKSNPNFGNRGKHLSEEVKAKISKANSGRVPYNKGIKNKTHKHDLIVPQLRNEYTILKSYTEVHKLHPELSYDTVWSLIKYGDTNKHFKKCND